MNTATTQRGAARAEFRAPRHRASRTVFIVGLGLAALSIFGMLTIDLSNQAIGVLVIVLSIALLLMGVPVGIAMMGAALLGLYAISSWRVVESTLTTVTFETIASWSYSVIPMFILMGSLLWKSGLTATAFDTARQWLGWMPGGLAVATNFAGAGLAASSGSTIGITYALGRVSIPEMIKAGYRPSLAAGAVAAAGTLGQIVPPSLLLVVYAGAASVPVGPQLLAGVVPGIILAVAFAIMIVGRSMIQPSLAPRAELTGVTWGTRIRSISGVLPILLVVLIVLGGLFLGVFTATEAGVFGMVTALASGIIHMRRKGDSWRAAGVMIKESVFSALAGTASVFLLLLGVAVLTRAIALSQIANTLAGAILDLGLDRVMLLLILILVYLVLGMFMDTLAMMLLTIPLLLPPLAAIGVDPLWFGVFLVVMAEVGLLTPPLGILSFVVHRIAADPQVNRGREIPITEVFKGGAWFAVTAMLVIVVLILVPDIVTWLPGLSLSE